MLRVATNIPHRGKLSDIAQGLLCLKGVRECLLEKTAGTETVLRVKGEQFPEDQVFLILERAGYSARLLERTDGHWILFQA